jgi:hypothetical protein
LFDIEKVLSDMTKKTLITTFCILAAIAFMQFTPAFAADEATGDDVKAFTSEDGALLPKGVKIKGSIKLRIMDWQYTEAGKLDRYRVRYSGQLHVGYKGDLGGVKIELGLTIDPKYDRRSTTITMGDGGADAIEDIKSSNALHFREAYVALWFMNEALKVMGGAFYWDHTNIMQKGLMWDGDRAIEGLYASYMLDGAAKISFNLLFSFLAEVRDREQFSPATGQDLLMLVFNVNASLLEKALTVGVGLWTHLNFKHFVTYVDEDGEATEYLALRVYAQYKLKEPKMAFWGMFVLNAGGAEKNLAFALGVQYGGADKKEAGSWGIRLFGHYAEAQSVVGALADDTWMGAASGNIGDSISNTGSLGLYLSFRYMLFKMVRARLDVIGSNPINAFGEDAHVANIRVRITFKFWFG